MTEPTRTPDPDETEAGSPEPADDETAGGSKPAGHAPRGPAHRASDHLGFHDDYRWRYLSTAWAMAYGLGFPLWVMASTIVGYDIAVEGTVLAALVVAWGATVTYVVGIESVRQWRDARTAGRARD